MSIWREWIHEPASAFRPGRRSLEPATVEDREGVRLLIGLMLSGLLLRLFLACKLTSICDDGQYYIFVADCLDRGDLTALRQFLSLNIYPAILLFLHRLGLDWIVAGKVWGLLVSTLLMLPLYDWLRRMCDRPTALIAVLLYAMHPEFVELSVEPTRDTTFFFLMTVTLWAAWRAMESSDWRWHVAAGLAVTLAVHTRLEGWFLFPVIVAWSLRRAMLQPGRRFELMAGNLWCIACIPLFVVLANVTLLRHQDHWEFGRVHDIYTLRNLVAKLGASIGFWGHIDSTVDAGAAPVLGLAVEQRHEATEGSWIYLRQMTGGIKWVTLYLGVVGLTRWRRFLRDFDFAALGGISLTFAALIGIRLMFLADINSRYFLTPLLCVLFVPALGFRRIAAWVAVRLASGRRQILVAATSVAIVAVAGFIDVARVKHPRRIAELKLGRYLQTRFVPGSRVLVDVGAVRVGIGMLGECPHVEWNPLDKRLAGDPLARSTDVMIFRDRVDTRLDDTRKRGLKAGLMEVQVEGSAAPPNGMEYLILARPEIVLPPTGRIAGESPRGPL